jgi:hypothetical protein
MPESPIIDAIAEQLAINKQLRRRFQIIAATGAMLLLLVLGLFVGRLVYYAWTYDSDELLKGVTVEAKRVGEVEKKFWNRELNRIMEHDLPILWNELLTRLERESTTRDAVTLLRDLPARPRDALADALLRGAEDALNKQGAPEALIDELRTPQTRERLLAILAKRLSEARESLSSEDQQALAAGLVDGFVTLLKER